MDIVLSQKQKDNFTKKYHPRILPANINDSVFAEVSAVALRLKVKALNSSL